MENSPRIQVLIATDLPLVGRGVEAVLSQLPDIHVVAHARSSSEVTAAFQGHKPQVMLIDLRLGGEDTLDVIRSVRQAYPLTGILVLSNHGGSEDIYRAIKAGARGYLLKNVTDTELIDAIRTVAQGKRHIAEEIANLLAERMDRSTLSPRELEVLQLVVKGKLNKEIANHLSISEATVKFHITGILEKLGVTDRTQAATTAILRGIIHPEDL